MVSADEAIVRATILFSIFQEKGWIGGGRKRIDLQKSFNNLCLIANRVSAEQFEMLIVMLKNYTRIEFESYIPSLVIALNKVKAQASDNTRFRVIPLLAPNDVGKNKSGSGVLYYFSHIVWSRSPEFSDFKLSSFTSASRLPKPPKSKSDLITFIVDDFIGSGGTVERFLDEYEQKYLAPNERVIFLSVAAMQAGLDYVQSRGYEVSTDIILPRGIADCDDFTNKAQAYDIMDQLEAMIARGDNFKYGYERSEGLVTLVRTPNNTFPVFWFPESIDGTVWPAPFPR